jgi:hypothetical protein
MQEDTKGEKLRYENESFRIRGKPPKQAYRADFRVIR